MWHMYEEKKGWYAVKDVRVLYVLITFIFQALQMVCDERSAQPLNELRRGAEAVQTYLHTVSLSFTL